MNNIKPINLREVWRPPHSDEEIDSGDEIVNTIIGMIRQNYNLKAFHIAQALHCTGDELKDYLHLRIGISCAELRHRLVLADAKWEVLHTTDKMGAVSERMHFPTAGAFSNFFSRYTGLSPHKYRRVYQHIETNLVYHCPDIMF